MGKNTTVEPIEITPYNQYYLAGRLKNISSSEKTFNINAKYAWRENGENANPVTLEAGECVFFTADSKKEFKIPFGFQRNKKKYHGKIELSVSDGKIKIFADRMFALCRGTLVWNTDDYVLELIPLYLFDNGPKGLVAALQPILMRYRDDLINKKIDNIQSELEKYGLNVNGIGDENVSQKKN